VLTSHNLCLSTILCHAHAQMHMGLWQVLCANMWQQLVYTRTTLLCGCKAHIYSLSKQGVCHWLPVGPSLSYLVAKQVHRARRLFPSDFTVPG
jgi:hypothetical protein